MQHSNNNNNYYYYYINNTSINNSNSNDNLFARAEQGYTLCLKKHPRHF